MGRSNFPGKPSRLSNKKVVSVLNGNSSSSNNNSPNNSIDAGAQNNVATAAATTAAVAAAEHEQHQQQQSNSNIEPDSDIALRSTAAKCDAVQANNKSKESQSNGGSECGTSDDGSNKKPAKKKRVSFKIGFETSDDAHIAKKEPNATFDPPVSIIKKECLRAMKAAPILMPSRLNAVTTNYRPLKLQDANNIDKLNSLTFKSQTRKKDTNCDENLSSNEDDQSDDEGESNGRRRSSDENRDSDEESNHSQNGDDDAKDDDDHSKGVAFQLPKRNSHSSRVIKPSRRFADEKNGLGKKKDAKLENDGDLFEKTSKKEAEDNVLKLSDHIKNNPFAKVNDDDSLFGSSSKAILRQSRLQYATVVKPSSALSLAAATPALTPSAVGVSTDKLFPSSLTTSTFNRNPIPSSIAVCDICATPAAISKPKRRYQGINLCDFCYKFITRTVKRLTNSDDKTPTKVFKCKKGGNCAILAGSVKTSKKRCQACLLKKFLQLHNLPNNIRSRVQKLLPTAMRNGETNAFASAFKLKTDANTSCGNNSSSSSGSDLMSPKSSGLNNLFGSSLASCRRLVPTWSTSKDSAETNEFRSFTSLSNPLTKNNSKFGSSPQIVPNILEKPSIMASSLNASLSPKSESTSKKEKTETKETKSTSPKTEASVSVSSKAVTPSNGSSSEPEESTRLRLRKKDRTDPVAASAATTGTTATTASTTSSTLTPAVTAIAGAELGKRQRIDLKGPRVKHVCRSASIVLGQPIATFGDENQILDTLDTPPRPESPNGIVDFHEPPASITAAQNEKHNEQNECADSTRLSPPATPIINDYDSESTSKEQMGEKSPSDSNKSDDASVTSIESVKRNEESKPSTRKVSRPNHVTSNSIIPAINKKVNSFMRKPIQKPVAKNTQSTISLDFWENYDPAEVSQSGFGLIFSEEVQHINLLCFLCGSYGQDPMIRCFVCCEHYHPYCVEDEYNLKQQISLDDTNVSLLESSMISGIGGSNALNSKENLLNWSCPRCTVCNSCNMKSDFHLWVKCQKCHKNYHSTCLGTSKRLGADRPLICAGCLKCKSCRTVNVSKFVGNLPMCSPCFKLRQKGKFCPLCQKCYDDNDFNIKMMECGVCKRWVHSKCENLTDEQYNMLSVLPENIEFICRICDPNASTWRDAVTAEFKAGLLSIVKLLSKTRQACALLKLSPRKKPSMCRFCIKNGIERSGENDFEDKLDDPFDFTTSQINSESNGLPAMKCYCSSSLSQKPNASQSLIDIKQKIRANKYYSLADFNYDMNVVINAAASDELMTAYKEILSEAFPWFQNETKACTDALVEDMYDSCNFDQSAMENDEADQQAPMIDIPDDIDEYFYQPMPINDTRICMFCKGCGDGTSSNESRLLYCGQNSWVHANCAMWSAEVFEEIDGSLQNVHGAISRGRMIKCSECGNKGATVGCNVRNCGEHYHFPCARKADCSFMTDKTVFCPQHARNATNDGKVDRETNFEVRRPVYVELDRKRKRSVCPKRVQFMIGSLHVKQLGRFVPTLSDCADAIVPVDFLCTRWYWSTKEPWKMVEYTIRTKVESNLNVATDAGRNFTVDHSNSFNKVQAGLAKIAKWHSSLLHGDDMESFAFLDRSIRMMNGHNEETNEDEPQSNADVLPPEIQDAIFNDIPHDILDVFSMLDIFPPNPDGDDLMSTTGDTKPEGIINSDLLRDNTTDDDISQSSQKGLDMESWTSVNMHAEDAMLSARSAAGQMHLKRNKSDLFGRSRGSRPSNNKLDSAISAKRRKRLDLKIPEALLLGLRKDEISNNINEITRQCLQSEEMKNKSFIWTAAQRIVQLNNESQQQQQQQKNSTVSKSSFKISQLDGMNDIAIDIRSQNAPVRCDRCHCTYLTQESYRRHLTTCEQFAAASESDSDGNTKTEIRQQQQQQQQPIQSNMVITSVNGSDYCNIPIIQQNNQNQQIFGINGANLNQLAMQNAVQIHNGQSLPIASIQNGTLPVQMQGMFINPTTATIQPQQSQIFGQQLTLGGIPQQVFPIQNLAQTATSHHNIQYQPQIITCSAANTSQVLTATPSQHQNITTSNYASIKTIQTQPQVNRNAIILPQAEKNSPGKKQAITKLQMSPTRAKPRIGTAAGAQKTIQIKKANVIKTENGNKTVAQITNTSVTNIRPTSTTQVDNNNIVIQSATNPTQSQPIIVTQAPNQGNLLQYVAASDGNNGLQYFTMPTNDVKPLQAATQYLTPNPLIPGTYQLQSDNNNLVLANTAPSLQMLPNGTLQLAQPQQPQVIGTLIQPQGAPIQCGMMSSEQMVLGAAPSFEMVANPLNGCMLLNNQPLYYGFETIVQQNTVMQSQQFVSTAMQGVLSQNASFSATTTQVFQASKIEPIMDMQPSYVVLNPDGTITTPQTQQPQILTTANLLQQAIPQIQNQTAQIQPTATANAGWRIIDDKSAIFSTANPTIMQSQPIQTSAANTISMPSPISSQTTQPPTPMSIANVVTTQSIPTVTPSQSPAIQLQKVQPQKQIVKQRATKQPSYTAKMVTKPIVKSSPIVVNEISSATPNNDVKHIMNITAKPAESTVKIDLNNTQTPLITTSSGNEMKISAKVVPPIVTTIPRKVTAAKPIVSGAKITTTTTAAAPVVKPKIVGKTLTKQQPPVQIQQQQPQKSVPIVSIAAPTPATTIPLPTVAVTIAKPTLTNIKSELNASKPMAIPKSPLPILSIDPPSGDTMATSDSAAPKVTSSSFSIKTATSVSSPMQQSPTISSTGNQFTSQTSNSSTPAPQLNSPPISDASAKQAPAPFTANLSNQTQINLPLSCSIQLPTAPYANGIPTNVVNPIQQYVQTHPRPTNRVLPMQTVLPKCSPVETIEVKPVDIKKQPNDDEFMPTSSGSSTPEIKIKEDPLRSVDDDMEVDSTGTGALEIDEDQISDFKIDKIEDDSDNSSDMDAFKDTFLATSSAEEAFDKLKKEEQIENTVKENISKIIEKFENDERSSMAEENLFNLPEVQNDMTTVVGDNDMIAEAANCEQINEQKENVNPVMPSIDFTPMIKLQKPLKESSTQKLTGPRLYYEIQSKDGFTFKSTSITEIWEKLFEFVQIARKAHGLSPLPVGPLADMCGYQMMGLKTNALKYLLEQLPGVERCTNYSPIYHKRAESTISQTTSSGYWSDCEEIKENASGAARCEKYKGRSEYDMFSWLASRHRKQPIQICAPTNGLETEILVRRGSGSNLPMAMRYRTLKDTYKDAVGVYRSHIHGRGLFCNRDIEAGEMVIEYAGELIRSTLTDKRERLYDSRNIGCYMFKIDDNLVVDATMRGNAARFINHSCEPNCYSKVVDILGHKHIIIFALRRIVQGEELTYDYKFPFEETKIPCSCGSRKCRKYLN